METGCESSRLVGFGDVAMSRLAITGHTVEPPGEGGLTI